MVRHGGKACVRDLGRSDFSALSAAVYYVRGGLPFAQSIGYLAGGAAGGVLAGRIFGKLPTLWLRRAFALLLLYGGVRAVLLL